MTITDEIEKEISRVKGILDHNVDGWWDWDISENREVYSARFLSMFGYTHDDFDDPESPDVWRSLIHPDDLRSALDAFEKHCEAKGAFPYWLQVRYAHKNGGWTTVLCRGHVVQWAADGAPLRMVGTHTVLDNPHERTT